MAGFQQVDVARNQFDSKGLELAIQSMTQNLNNFYSTGTINEIGAIVAYGGTIPPTGFLLCDGSAISRSTFSALFAVLGTTYGVGDGSTTFNLPDLTGRVPVGLDTSQTEFNTMGKTGGHKLLQAHSHNVVYTANSGTLGLNSGATGYKFSWSTGGDSSISTVSKGGGNSENLQPYQVVNYIIRYALPVVDTANSSIQSAFRVQRLSTQAVTGSIMTTVQLNSVQYDLGTHFDINTYRFTAPCNGIYHFDGSVGIANNDPRVIASIYKNGLEVARGTNQYSPAVSNRSTVGTDLYLSATDYVTLNGWRGSNGNLEPDSGHGLWLSGHLVKQLT